MERVREKGRRKAVDIKKITEQVMHRARNNSQPNRNFDTVIKRFELKLIEEEENQTKIVC